MSCSDVFVTPTIPKSSRFELKKMKGEIKGSKKKFKLENEALIHRNEMNNIKKKIRPLLDLFKKHNQHGNRFEYSSEMQIFLLQELAHSESSGTLQRMLESFSRMFPDLILNPSIPGRNYINRCRLGQHLC
jgi:hypothetical protein